jgi:transcriptional regulator with XRE-family HTH domain
MAAWPHGRMAARQGRRMAAWPQGRMAAGPQGRHMDDLKVGRVVRAVRRRRGLRQRDVAERAEVGRWAVSTLERGEMERLRLGTIRRIGAALEVRLPLAPSWRGAELPRLIDSRHAELVDQVVAQLRALGWEMAVEYSFNHYGERGAVDILAWRAQYRALLIIEVKSEMDDLQRLLGVLDRKARVVPRLVQRQRGWLAATLGVVVVVRESSTSRKQVDRFRAMFEVALPARNVQIRRWLGSPGPPLRGLWFFHFDGGGGLMEGGSGGGGARRVRVRRAGNPDPATAWKKAAGHGRVGHESGDPSLAGRQGSGLEPGPGGQVG